jgi:hypothetical protein
VGAVGAVVGLLVGITTLTDWFVSKTSDPPPPQIDSQLLWAEAQNERLPLVDYLRENGMSTRGLTPRELREVGLIFAVRVRLRGTVGTPIPLQWRMFTAGGRGLPKVPYSRIAGSFTPRANDHARTVAVWVPFPPRAGRYVVRFSLLDKKGQPLDLTEAPFAVSHIPALR